jgi:hypothetical protein
MYIYMHVCVCVCVCVCVYKVAVRWCDGLGMVMVGMPKPPPLLCQHKEESE